MSAQEDTKAPQIRVRMSMYVTEDHRMYTIAELDTRKVIPAEEAKLTKATLAQVAPRNVATTCKYIRETLC